MDDDSNILFLRAVHVGDCKSLEDMWDARIDEEAEPDNIDDSPAYDKIPSRFTSVDAWPQKTNLLCWHCSLVPRGRPWTMPTSFHAAPPGAGHKYIMDTYGIACDGECGSAWINKHVSLHKRWERFHFMCIFSEELTGRAFEGSPAPDPTCMIQYGGSLVRREYEDLKKKSCGTPLARLTVA